MVWSRLRVLSCLILLCLVLSCLVLSCLVLSCLVPSCHVLSYPTLSCFVLSCLILSCLVLSYLFLSCIVWSYLVLVLSCLSCIILSCLVLSYLALPCLVLLSCFILSWLVLSRLAFVLVFVFATSSRKKGEKKERKKENWTKTVQLPMTTWLSIMIRSSSAVYSDLLMLGSKWLHLSKRRSAYIRYVTFKVYVTIESVQRSNVTLRYVTLRSAYIRYDTLRYVTFSVYTLRSKGPLGKIHIYIYTYRCMHCTPIFTRQDTSIIYQMRQTLLNP